MPGVKVGQKARLLPQGSQLRDTPAVSRGRNAQLRGHWALTLTQWVFAFDTCPVCPGKRPTLEPPQFLPSEGDHRGRRDSLFLELVSELTLTRVRADTRCTGCPQGNGQGRKGGRG
jgi:hypothetical protein